MHSQIKKIFHLQKFQSQLSQQKSLKDKDQITPTQKDSNNTTVQNNNEQQQQQQLTSKKNQYQQNVFRFSINSNQQDQNVSPNILQTDKNSNLSPSGTGNGQNQNKLITQRSKLLSKQNSNCLLPSLSNEFNFQHKNNLNGHTTVMCAIQEQILVEQDQYVTKKRKKIIYVLLGKSKEEVMAKALRHLKDAILLRPPRNAFESNLKFGDYFLYFYEIRWTLLWRFLQKTLSYLFIIQTFLEPQTEADNFNDQTTENYAYYSEIVILSFCLIDNVLSLYIYRPSMKNAILKILSYIFQFSLFIIFLTDFIIFWHTSLIQVRFSSILRPLWLIQFHKDIQNILKSMLRSSRRVLDIFLFFIFWSCFWGYIGYNLLSEYKTQLKDDIYFVFGSIGESILGMYTLITLDTYPTIIENIIKDNPYYLLFFVPFVAMNLFFFLCVPVAVIFESYKQQRALIYLKEDKITKDALTYCFYCLIHYNKEDFLSKDQFFNLFNAYYKNKAIRQKIDELYQILNIDQQDKMTLYEFQDTVALMKTSERLYNNSNKYWDSFRNFCNKYLYFEKISRSHYWSYFILFIVFSNTIALIYYSAATVYTDNSSSLDDIYTNIEIFFLSVYITDVCIKMIGLGINEYFDDYWNNFDFFMAIVSLVTIIGLKYIYFIKETKSTKLIKITKLQRVLKIFRSIRSIKLLSFLKLGADALLRVQKLFHKIAICIPSVWGFVSTYFLISISYGFLGIFLFNTNNNPDNGNPYDKSNYTDFNSIQNALLVLFQVVAESKWTDFLYGYGYQTSLPLSAAYFVTYHMFSIFFFMSLIKGVIWDVFNVVETYLKEQEYDELAELAEQADSQNNVQSELSHKQTEELNAKNHQINQEALIQEDIQFGRVNSFRHTNLHFGQRKADQNEKCVADKDPISQDKDNQNEVLVTEPVVLNFGEEEKNSNINIEKNSLLSNQEQKHPKLSNYHNLHINEIIKNQFDIGNKDKDDNVLEENTEEQEKESNNSSEIPSLTNKNSSSVQESKKQKFNFSFKNNVHFSKENTNEQTAKDLEETPAEETGDNEDVIQKKMLSSEEGRFIVRINTFQDSQNSSILLIQKKDQNQNEYPPQNIENVFDEKMTESSYKLNKNNLLSLNSTSQNSPQLKPLIQTKSNFQTPIKNYKSHLLINDNNILVSFDNQKDSKKINAPLSAESKANSDKTINNGNNNNNNNIQIIKNQNGDQFLTLSRINYQIPSILNKKMLGSFRRSESSNVCADKDYVVEFQFKKPDSDFDKYYRKRSQLVNTLVDINAQLDQLEKYLQLYDQYGLQVAELRRQRIIDKHQSINVFSLSKQFALQRRTYLKDNPLNINYGNRQEYLETIEQLLGYSDDIKSFLNKVNIPSQRSQEKGSLKKNKNRFRKMFQNYYTADVQNKNDKNLNSYRNNNDSKHNNQDENLNFISISEFGDAESQYPSYTAFEHQSNVEKSLNMRKEICDYTFIRLNGIFSFLLHLLSNFNHFDIKFAIQKLFIIEQSINQLIFGEYDEDHRINHFKFILYSSNNKKYFMLNKEPESIDSKTENHLQIPQNTLDIEVCALPSEYGPWSALSKSLDKQNQIYFIKSLFSEIENDVDKRISGKLSDMIQFMGGQQYCLEDMTQYQIEQYCSFIYPVQNIQTQQAYQSQKANQNSYNQNQSYICFICNKQKRKFIDKKSDKQKKKLDIHKTFQTQLSNKGAENLSNSNKIDKGNNHNQDANKEKTNNTPKIIISPSSQLSNSQKVKAEEENRKQSIFSRQNQANITKSYNQKNKVIFKKDQEHIIKIYSQIQQFFFTHCHLLDQIIQKLSSQISQEMPNYEYK
ncbi:cation channel family transporter (macronuclear) [Tetrahymena thermophila SB210]|uniref:Cation channel family transporter n=1 Tax=Tetrahymena thermophila (strain SB210) TaxID=312017 RepID=Q23RF4_TETTS|nr:cation channel family transporter [Tetrahymena thermophila SB210]EAR99094.2 cation channel family transporter [Tetrahymena thermophila SB210]|eukprot:XP_001019339.2 cation channel family transporter [Tetrahymena thermophila SB210]